MAVRAWRRSGAAAHAADEGPFVSFTDLFIGILFLFLILVAALMLIHQEAMARANAEIRQLREYIKVLEAELERLRKLDQHTPFRLAIVYNSYQRPGGSQQDWRFTRTVQVYRSPNGNCLENVVMRNNLNLTWKPEVDEQEIPTGASGSAGQTGSPCTLTGSGERWNSATETGGVDRVSPNLYSGYTVLHTKDGDKTVELQFRVLSVYDDYYRASSSARRLPPPPADGPARPTGAISLQ